MIFILFNIIWSFTIWIFARPSRFREVTIVFSSYVGHLFPMAKPITLSQKYSCKKHAVPHCFLGHVTHNTLLEKFWIIYAGNRNGCRVPCVRVGTVWRPMLFFWGLLPPSPMKRKIPINLALPRAIFIYFSKHIRNSASRYLLPRDHTSRNSCLIIFKLTCETGSVMRITVLHNQWFGEHIW